LSDEKISSAILKRLDALSLNVVSDVLALTFIDLDGDKYSVVEHYHSPQGRGVTYKRYTVNSPDEYISKGGIVFHCYDLED